MEVRLITATQDADALIEYAGRVCYRSESSGDPAAFIRARMRDGHESILEHASATFEVRGISRACSHQLVRHRLASYSQESQRYVNAAGSDVVWPPSIAENPQARALYREYMDAVDSAYSGLLALGVRKEDARFVLPNATMTRLVVTMNFREYLHFFRQRLTTAAQWEIREVAARMLLLLVPRSLTVFGGLHDQLQAEHPEWFHGLVAA